MNLRELEYIVAVADLANFSRAADRCAVSQPTLSAQIKKLEAEIGVKIFERTSKQVLPTETGQVIIASARRILGEANAIREVARAARDPFSGRYRLGAFPTLASYLFPTLVPLLKEEMPKLRLVLMEEKSDVLLDKLRKGQIDAAFLALPVKEDGLETVHLFDDPFFLAVSERNELARQTRVNTDILRNQKLMLLEEGHCLRDQSLAICNMMGISDDADMRATSLETLRQMVRADTGITLMPEIAKGNEGDGIRYIPFENKAPFRSIGLVRRKSCARAQVFDVIRECAIAAHNQPMCVA